MAADERRSQASRREHVADQRSVYSYKSGASRASRMSYKQRVEAEKLNEETKSQWNNSVASKDSRRLTTEDRVAHKIAAEVLKDN